MRFFKLAVIGCFLGASSVMADLNIAVLNVQQALSESEAAKRYAVDSEKKFAPKIKEIQKIDAEATKLRDKFAKEGEKMAQDERERLDLEFSQKMRDLKVRTDEFNAQKQKADNETLQKLKPNLDKAIGEVIKQGNYDLVIDRGALIYVKDGAHDITAQVTQYMNKLK